MFLKIRQILLFFLLIIPAFTHAEESPNLTVSSGLSKDGTFNLQWNLPDNTQIELQQASLKNPAFITIYTGADTATVITGQPDGTYRFRARLLDQDNARSDWSASVEIQVAHHPLSRALGFFAIGLLIFIATMLLILSGSRRTRNLS